VTADHLSDEQLASSVAVELLGRPLVTDDVVKMILRHVEAARFSERARIVSWLRTRAAVAALADTNRGDVTASVFDEAARAIERGTHQR